MYSSVSGTPPVRGSESPSGPPGGGTARPGGTSGRPKKLAPTPKESFDELAKKVARAEPRRGSVMQPPPAWTPDEVTLGFAMVSDGTGAVHELPEPELLATILIAAESDRRSIRNRVASSFEEEIDAVANLYWPFLVVHRGGPQAEAAIFDGTGVWKRTFRYTVRPSLEGIKPLLDRGLSSVDLLAKIRDVTPTFGRELGADVLTVEGFLPLDPPLLFDVLSQSSFQSDPQSPHAGFLPARHKVEWYDEILGQMARWLDRFEADLQALGEMRGQLDARVQEARQKVDEEYRAREETARQQTQQAVDRVEEELARLRQEHDTEIRRCLETIRKAQAVVAHSETSVSTAEALSLRATHRRTDPAPHQARSRQAQTAIRDANRQIAEARREVEKLHERQQKDQEATISKVAQVERQGAQALAALELFRDDFHAAAFDLLQSIDGQIAARSSQRNLLAGYFLPLPALETVRVVWFPLWMATLRGPRGVRQIVFPPMQVRTAKGLASALKRLLGGIVLPLEPRTAQFDKVLRPTMEEALSRDPWLSAATQELTRAADVLVDPDVLVRLQEGLGELSRQGWISRKQQEDFLRAYTERAQRRAASGTTVHAPVPAGVSVEPVRPPPPSSGSPPPGTLD